MLANGLNLDELNEDEDLLARVVGCTPIRLEDAHLAELRSLIVQLSGDLAKTAKEEKNFERFQKLVELYGDEPQLLEPVLPELVDALLVHIRWPANGQTGQLLPPLSVAALVRLRVLSAVHGYKFLMRFLPHKFELLEPVLAALEQLASRLSNTIPGPINAGTSSSSNSQFIDKQLVHILVIWLLIICKNPFNLTRVQQQPAEMDSFATGETVTGRIVNCLESFLECLTCDAGLNVIPTLLAQILTRNPDNHVVLQTRFQQFQRVFHDCQAEADGGQQLINQLSLANALLKLGRRREIRPFAEKLLKSLTPNFLRSQCPNILVRNLNAKLLQRLALVLLRPKLAQWRYRCGLRSLEENLRIGERNSELTSSISTSTSTNTKENGGTKEKEEQPENDDDEDVDDVPYDEVEMLLAELLLKIRDRDNMVRWTAAKGVARICARIPLKMAAEVVAAVLKDCFNNDTSKSSESSSAWMGGCLTLAELCRRGCLLPEQVPMVISTVLSHALVFEQSQLGFMLAVNVRDSACYICWAFARAYEAKLLREHLRPLAGTLLSIALFDREVNVRRAASAAFQENVGRNDSFPHGIPILQLVDYAEVARIRHCYLELAVKVAQFPEYIHPMLTHLCSLKCRHWDETLRELAAEALGRLAPFDGDFSFNQLLPELCGRLNSMDPGERHGAYFGVANLFEALADRHQVLFHAPRLISTIVGHCSDLDTHRTKGFSLIGKSLCRLIQALCTVGCVLDDGQLSKFHDILDTVVGDRNTRMARHAVHAFPWLMAYYRSGQRLPLLLARIRSKYFPEIVGPTQSEQLRCSSIIPLGHLHAEFLEVPFADEKSEQTTTTLGEVLIHRLIGVILDPNTPKWVFARVAAIETIAKLLLTATQNAIPIGWLDWSELVECICQAADDYTATTNGNIGRFGRRAAILALGQLLPMAFEQQNKLPIGQKLLDQAIGKVVERACESIDDLREKASTALASLTQLGAAHPLTAHLTELELLQRVFVLPTSRNGSTLGTPTRKQQHLAVNGDQQNGGNDSQAMARAATAPEFCQIDFRQSRGFARLAALLDSPAYGWNALAGFVLSAGSVCGWTRENAFLAIATHLKPHKQDVQFLENFLRQLHSIYTVICARDSDPCPVLILFRMLLTDGQLKCLERQPDCSPAFAQICELAINLALCKAKSKVKLEAIAVLGSLLQLNPASQLYRRVLRLLLSLLSSPYAALREKAVEQLFEAFSLFGANETDEDGAEQRIEQALELLAQTDWGSAKMRKELEELRTRISDLILPPPSKQN